MQSAKIIKENQVVSFQLRTYSRPEGFSDSFTLGETITLSATPAMRKDTGKNLFEKCFLYKSYY
jgi:hypothetical protein